MSSSRQFKRYEEAFSKLSNKSDLLPVDSVCDFLRLTGIGALPEELDEMLPDYSVNGFLNFASVLDLGSRFRTQQFLQNENRELLLIFKLLDEFNSGYVYVEELKQACLLAGDTLRGKEFDHLLHTTGLSGKERLSFYEYMDVLLKIPSEPF
eukprot:TRINITY_DN3512_c1_g2_i1.p1 TRINITY_DN3512_c1_g2~~TRINITY_DN3512_c1_g2_i1.p1  ORF type:complete len:152 (+),score=31.79 TRINITY_DN3512_c1_g2_i1:49-504(+)